MTTKVVMLLKSPYFLITILIIVLVVAIVLGIGFGTGKFQAAATHAPRPVSVGHTGILTDGLDNYFIFNKPSLERIWDELSILSATKDKNAASVVSVVAAPDGDLSRPFWLMVGDDYVFVEKGTIKYVSNTAINIQTVLASPAFFDTSTGGQLKWRPDKDYIWPYSATTGLFCNALIPNCIPTQFVLQKQ